MADKFSNRDCIDEEVVMETLKHKYCGGNVIPFCRCGLVNGISDAVMGRTTAAVSRNVKLQEQDER